MGPPRGRSRELERVRAALDEGARLVTLLGPPGVGKTHLARYLVAALGAGRETRFVELSDALSGAKAADDAELTARVRQAFALNAPSDAGEDLASLVDRFDALAPIVVIDGYERVAAVGREVLADWLDASAAVTVLVTSRERADLPGEVVVPLSPLEHDDAVALFVELVRRVDPDRHIDAGVAGRIVARLDRLPLALELSAPRAARIGLDELARLLDDDARDGLPPSGVLARAIERSWSLLGEDERRVLATCSVFRGGFTLGALRAVLAHTPLTAHLADRAGELVTALADSSLLMGRDLPAGARFELLAVVRAFAADRSMDVAAQARTAHARAFAASPPLPFDDPRTWTASMIERDNLLAAWAHARAHAPELTAPLALTLHALLVREGSPELQARILGESLAVATTPSARIDLSIALARHHGLKGMHARAIPLLDAAAMLARETDDRARLGWVDALACFSLRAIGRLDEARSRAVATLELARAVADPRLEAMLEQVIGLVDLVEKKPRDAAARFRATVAIARTTGAPRLEAIGLANLAYASHRMERHDEASTLLREAQAKFASISDRVHVVKLDVLEVLLARTAGELERAESIARRALDDARDHGDVIVQVELRAELARIALARGDSLLARRFLEEGEALLRRIDDVTLDVMLREVRAALGHERDVEAPLRIARDGSSFVIGDLVVDLRRRAPLRRLLGALAQQRIDGDGRPLDVHALLAAGWPGERMRASSGAARVYMAVRRLRALGLERVLVTDELGYRLDRGVPAAWLENVRRG